MTTEPAASLAARRIERAGSMLARSSLYLGAAVLFALLALTCADVFGRYVLNAPVNGKTELTRFLMAGLIAFALPVVSAAGENITVDLFDSFFSRRAAAIRNVLVDLACGSMAGVLAWWTAFRARRLMEYGYVSDFLHIPLHPVAYFVAAMILVTGITLLVKALIDGLYVARPELMPEAGGRHPGGAGHR